MTYTPTSLPRSKANAFCGGTCVPLTVADSEWDMLVQACEAPLLAALCRPAPPVEADDPNLYPSWLRLLAIWVKASFAADAEGLEHVQSWSMRNFSQSGIDPVEMSRFADNNSDLLSLFSQCGSRVSFPSNWNEWIYAPDNQQVGRRYPDAPPMFGGAL